jgi:hypothetical protein
MAKYLPCALLPVAPSLSRKGGVTLANSGQSPNYPCTFASLRPLATMSLDSSMAYQRLDPSGAPQDQRVGFGVECVLAK